MTTMRYKLLGKSGLRVSEISLGTMTFGEEWGFGVNAAECKKLLDLYVEAGGNFIDTANKYTEGSSERIIADLIAAERERFVVATKYTLSMRKGDPNASGNHRKNLVQSVNASLKRLRLDYIDLLWVHAWDFTTDPAQVMRALDDVVRAGKVLHIGISDAPAWLVSQANTIADLRGWTPFDALQIEYSLIQRTVERELLPMAKAFGLTVTPWGAIGGGVLSGKYTRNAGGDIDSKRVNGNQSRLSDRNLAIARVVDAIADETGHTSTQIALNWVRQQGANIVPIIGARKPEQLSDSLACLSFALSSDHLQRLNEASHVELGFPHDFIRNENIRNIVYGDQYPKLDWDAARHGAPRRA
jgi:aryl-alcohol dehydrogenase-like predicted oxidoreductase